MAEIGIYDEKFIDYLKEYFGEDKVKIKGSTIVCPCPWCEWGEDKRHYHLYISTELPIFHCFYAGCNESGRIKKLLKKISGTTKATSYINTSKIKKIDIRLKSNKKYSKIILPEIRPKEFSHKEMYLHKRFGFIDIDLTQINGLIFDIEKFVTLNKIQLDEKQKKLLPFLQSNFVGFKSENDSLVMMRNIDASSKFRHYKLKLQEPQLLDYYLIRNNPKGNKIVLAEGVFDIYVEYLYDNLRIKNDVLLYACGYTTSYAALMKSLAFYENIYQPEVIILSDKDVKSYFYKKLKMTKRHLFSNMKIFYNKCDKDFGSLNCIPQQLFI